MDKIDSLDKINGFVSDIRSLRKGYLSNFFLDRKKHSIWIEKGELFSAPFNRFGQQPVFSYHYLATTGRGIEGCFTYIV